MAEVPSTFQLRTGSEAPGFTLPDARGVTHDLSGLMAGQKGLVIAFVCNHCPFVIHLAEELGRFAHDYADKGLPTVGINANDIANYPADAPEKMIPFAENCGWEFPYLYDESQEVAKAYAAACTPDFYLFDAAGRLAYAGQFDDSRPGKEEPVTGNDLRRAADCVISDEPVREPWYPSSGCNIKWKPGQEPSYF